MIMYDGCVVGYIEKPTTNVYFVETERRKNVIGMSVDVVYSKRCFLLGEKINYKFRKNGEEFIAYA